VEQAKLWNTAGCAWVEAQQLLDRILQPFEEWLVGCFCASGAERVLDVGCGTGSTTRAVARLIDAEGLAVGIDISEPMIAAARSLAERDRVPAEFVCADAQTHAFEPSSFDLIMSRFGVMFFDDPVQAFANLRSALREGGLLCCIAWRSPEENPFMTTAEGAAASLLPNLPPRVANAPGQFGFADRRRVEAILQESGWAAIEIEPLDVTCSLPAQALTGYATRFGPVGIALRDADDETRARVAAAVRAAFEPYVQGDEARFTACCWTIRATSLERSGKTYRRSP
jgi:SAM-dependent methyltransferase